MVTWRSVRLGPALLKIPPAPVPVPAALPEIVLLVIVMPPLLTIPPVPTFVGGPTVFPEIVELVIVTLAPGSFRSAPAPEKPDPFTALVFPVIELESTEDDLVEILANDHPVARGQIVVTGTRIAIEVTEIIRRSEIVTTPGATIGEGAIAARAAALA